MVVAVTGARLWVKTWLWLWRWTRPKTQERREAGAMATMTAAAADLGDSSGGGDGKTSREATVTAKEGVEKVAAVAKARVKAVLVGGAIR